MRPRIHAPGTLEDASAHLRAGVGATRRGGKSLPELRSIERGLLEQWAETKGCLLAEDPTLKFERRSSHGEHSVAFCQSDGRWWKTTHPGKAGVGVEFLYDLMPPFAISGVVARELLPSEYLERMILHNREFGDDVRLEGYLAGDHPSLVISQSDVQGSPATLEQMTSQMLDFGFQPLGNLEVGRNNSVSFYHPGRRIVLFDAHPGNFFHASGLTLPIDGILAEIQHDPEHLWLMDRIVT